MSKTKLEVRVLETREEYTKIEIVIISDDPEEDPQTATINLQKGDYFILEGLRAERKALIISF